MQLINNFATFYQYNGGSDRKVGTSDSPVLAAYFWSPRPMEITPINNRDTQRYLRPWRLEEGSSEAVLGRPDDQNGLSRFAHK